MRRKFAIHGRIDLDGTHECCILTADSALLDQVNHSPHGRVTLSLVVDQHVCGVIADRAETGDDDVLEVDTLKMQYLGLRDGDPVEVDPLDAPEALSVVLRAAPVTLASDLDSLRGKLVVAGEKTAIFTLTGEPRFLVIESTDPPDCIVQISSQTRVTLAEGKIDDAQESFKSIGGLDSEIRQLRELIEYPLRFPVAFERLGIRRSKGVILHGPPGTGKTMLIRALAGEIGAAVFQISGPEVFNKYVGESERQLREVFEKARRDAPALVVIDEIDSLAPSRDRSNVEVESRVVATLLTLMDGLNADPNIVVVGTTNRLHAIDQALRREGRFGTELRIGAPGRDGRRQILRIHTRRMPTNEDVDLDAIADAASGFVGSDLAQVCREAAYVALREVSVQNDIGKVKEADLLHLTVRHQHFEEALRLVKPSALRDFAVEYPKENWDDLVGLEREKKLLREILQAHSQLQRDLRKLGGTPPVGICIYGPAGTGKTLLVRALASHAKAALIVIQCTHLLGRPIDECGRLIEGVFAKSREAAPAIVFCEDIDALGQPSAYGPLQSIWMKLISEIEAVSGAPVLVVATAQNFSLVEPRLLSQRCLGYQIQVPLPDAAQRHDLLVRFLARCELDQRIDLVELASLAEGLSGAEINAACTRAMSDALRNAEGSFEKVNVATPQLQEHIRQLVSSKARMAGVDIESNPDPDRLISLIGTILSRAAENRSATSRVNEG